MALITSALTAPAVPGAGFGSPGGRRLSASPSRQARAVNTSKGAPVGGYLLRRPQHSVAPLGGLSS